MPTTCSFLLEVASVGYVDSLTEQLFPVYVQLRMYARTYVWCVEDVLA